MKFQTDSKPSIRRHEHESMRVMAAAATHMNSILMGRPRVYVSTHLDVPRTASSQCLLDDADIADTVKDAIGCITTVPMETLQVGVKDGWVTLRGYLDSWATRDMIEHIALHCVGVRGVVNSITVEENPIALL